MSSRVFIMLKNILFSSSFLFLSSSVIAANTYLLDGLGNPVLSGNETCITASEQKTKQYFLQCGDDQDQDKIVDSKDKCPDTPQISQVDQAGCPIDSDTDGIADYKDKCPNNIDEEAASVNEMGCPKDSDEDGVADYRDRCPNTPVTLKVASAGCELCTHYLLLPMAHLITFPFDSILLSINQKPVLDSVAKTWHVGLNKTRTKIKKIPPYHKPALIITGHTDSTGHSLYNTALSQRRAEVVADYLIFQGAAVDDIKLIAKGESQPADSNKTMRGRKKNRRVYIELKGVDHRTYSTCEQRDN